MDDFEEKDVSPGSKNARQASQCNKANVDVLVQIVVGDSVGLDLRLGRREAAPTFPAVASRLRHQHKRR